MSEQSDLILGIRRAMGFDDKPEVQMSREEFDAIIASHIAPLEAENAKLTLKNKSSLANNLCPDHRDKQGGQPCLACKIESLETALAASQAECERLRKGEVVIGKCELCGETIHQRESACPGKVAGTLRHYECDTDDDNAALRQQVETLRGVLEMLGSGASASLSCPDDMDSREFTPHRDHQNLADWVMSSTLLCLEDDMTSEQIYQHHADVAKAKTVA